MAIPLTGSKLRASACHLTRTRGSPFGYCRIHNGRGAILLPIAQLADSPIRKGILTKRFTGLRQKLELALILVAMMLFSLPQRVVADIWPGWVTFHAVAGFGTALAAWSAAAMALWWMIESVSLAGDSANF